MFKFWLKIAFKVAGLGLLLVWGLRRFSLGSELFRL